MGSRAHPTRTAKKTKCEWNDEPLGQVQHANMCITGTPGGQEKEQEIENQLGKTMVEDSRD